MRPLTKPAAKATMPPLRAVASESFLLVNSHSRHFLALSLLFLLLRLLLPLCRLPRPPFHTQSLLLLRLSLPPHPPRHHPLSLSAALFSVSLVFAVLAACSVIHSALCAFYGRPVKLHSSLQSTASSFLRMVATLSFSLSPLPPPRHAAFPI